MMQTLDEQVIMTIHKAFKTISVIDNYCLDSDLTMLQLRILWQVKHQKEIKMTDLAAIMNVTAATMSSQIDKLFELGYIERNHESEDRRVVKIVLSEKGVATFEQEYQKKIEKYKKVLSVLTEEEKISLLQIFEKVLNAHQKPSEQK